MMTHVVMYSGGISSWAAACRVRDAHGADDLQLVFCDTLIESSDVYRFLLEGAAYVLGVDLKANAIAADALPEVEVPGAIEERKNITPILAGNAQRITGGRLIWLQDGRTPWELFEEIRLIGNTRADPCSRVLKRDLFRSWLEETHDPDECVLYLGLDWTETHRWERAAQYWDPWRVESPLVEEANFGKQAIIDEARAAGIEPPAAYERGMPHANCSDFCVKAGNAQFERLLKQNPKRYAYHEAQEEALRAQLGDVSILVDRRREAIAEHVAAEHGVDPSGVEVRGDASNRTALLPDGTEVEAPGRVPLTMRRLRKRVETEAADDPQQSLFGDVLSACGCMVDFDDYEL